MDMIGANIAALRSPQPSGKNASTKEQKPRHDNALRAATRAFKSLPTPSKVPNVKASRRRKGKSEGYHLAQRRELDEKRRKTEARLASRADQLHTLRCYTSAPLLGAIKATASPSRQVISCLTFQDNSDLQSSSNDDLVRDQQKRKSTMGYSEPLAGFSAFFRGSGAIEDPHNPPRSSTLGHPISMQPQIKTQSEDVSIEPASRDFNIETCNENKASHIYSLRQSHSNITLGLGSKARSLSKSFRKRFSHFSSQPITAAHKVPDQQVTALRNHFGANRTSPPQIEGFGEKDHWPDFDENMQARAQKPPSHEDISLISQHNQHIDADHVRSRVTSWNESEDLQIAGSTTGALESIDERGEEIEHRKLSRTIGSTYCLSAGLQPHNSAEIDLGNTTGINSRRVYSALLKRMSFRGRTEAGRRSVNQLGSTSLMSTTGNELQKGEHRVYTQGQTEGTVNQSTIRVIPNRSSSLTEGRASMQSSSLRSEPALERGIISPSIYSEHEDMRGIFASSSVASIPKDKSSEDSGIALVQYSRPIARWSLEDSPQRSCNISSDQPILRTSAEWRTWVTSQIGGLDNHDLESLSDPDPFLSNVSARHYREEAQINGSGSFKKLTLPSPSCDFSTNVHNCQKTDTLWSQNRVMPGLACMPGDTFLARKPLVQSHSREFGNKNKIHPSTHTLPVLDAMQHMMFIEPHPGSQELQRPPLFELDNSHSNIRRDAKQRLDSAIGGFESQAVLKNTRTMGKTKTAPIPHYSPTDENFLRKIRRGPYDTGSPSPRSGKDSRINEDRGTDEHSLIDKLSGAMSPSHIDLLDPYVKYAGSTSYGSPAAFL